jgi:DNA polymerase III sliding clamp (beta) subunit (PCNA family)
MKLAIGKEQILQGLQAVQNVVGSRTTLPILSNVLLRASDNRHLLRRRSASEDAWEHHDPG